MKRMLIVEDDDAIRTGLCRSLSSDTLDTVGVGNLVSARQRLDAERYEEHFKSRAMDDFPILSRWAEQGFLHGDRFLGLTEKGLEWSDYLGPKLISPEIKKAMDEWEKQHSSVKAGRLSE